MPKSKNRIPPALRESLPEGSLNGFSIRTFVKDCVDFHWHFHPELELVHIAKGSGIRHIGRSIQPYGAGDLCLIGGNMPHAFTSRFEQRDGARWTVLHLAPDRWGADFWRLAHNRNIAQLFMRSKQGIAFGGVDAEICSGLMARLEPPGNGDFPLSIVMEILERLSRSKNQKLLNPAAQVQEANIDGRFQSILRWLDEHFRDAELSQEEAAARIGMSPAAFSRFFRQHSGRTFRRYLNELRVAHVCSRLKFSDETVSQAAYDAGFSNIANFNRRFQEILGQTPTSYRK